jgi:hypothetical protein
MLTTDFYDIIDQKLFSIIKKYQDDEAILRHQNSETGQKAYAFLIWFLEFYGKTTNYLPYITDGDGDGSCDIIFNALDNRGNTVYYVVQSKWNTRKNALKKMDSQELGYTLNNFSTILRGHKKPTNNEALNQKQSELLAHVEKNGRVKFIFLSLCHENGTDIGISETVRKTCCPRCQRHCQRQKMATRSRKNVFEKRRFY